MRRGYLYWMLSLKGLLLEILLEAMFGEKFKLRVTKNGQMKAFIGMATANAKPGERPYRITWFSLGQAITKGGIPDNRHVDLDFDEMKEVLSKKGFPPEIVQRLRERYPNDDSELLGDRYQLGN